MVGVVWMVTLLVEYYFVQSSVGWWSLLLDVFILSPQHESLVNRLTYGCKPVKTPTIFQSNNKSVTK